MRLIKDKKSNPSIADGALIYLEDVPYRILSHETFDNDVTTTIFWLVELGVTRFNIIKRSFTQLNDAIANGTLINCVDTDGYIVPLLNDGDRAITDLRFGCIQKYIVSLYPNYSVLSQRGVRKEGIEQLAAACNLSIRRLRSYLLQYVQSGGAYWSVVDGRIMRALNNNNNNTYFDGNVRGKKRKDGTSSSVQNNAELVAQYEEAYKKYVQELNRYQYDSESKYKQSLVSVYRGMIIKYYSTTDEDGNIVLLPENQRPSYDRFYNWVRTTKLHGDKVSNHAMSARDQRNNNRILTGTSQYGVFNLMEMVEIDENEASFCLVSANPGTPNQVIGHAIIYLAVDVLTHRVVGASVSFANNSYEGFLDLMDSMMMSDIDNAFMFGAEYDESKPVFPGCTLPREIRVDHGSEYVSHAIAENLTGGSNSGTLEGVPIAISLVPVATGSLKGIVERFFGQLHRTVQSALKSGFGYVTGTHATKHFQEAVMTIEDFRRIVYETIRLHNNSPVPDYPVTPSITEAIPVITPNTLWDYYSKSRLSGFDVSNDDIRAAARFGLMKKDHDFKLSKRQISYRNTLYWDLGEDDGLKYEAICLGEKSASIEMRYDPRSVNTLYRADKKTGRIFRYRLAEKRPEMQEFRNMRWPVVDKWITEWRSKRYEAIAKKADERMMSEAKIASIAQQALIDKGPSKNTVKNRRESAQLERAALVAFDQQRKDQIFYDDSADSAEIQPEIPEISVTPIEPATSDDDDEVITEVGIMDVDAMAKAYGL